MIQPDDLKTLELINEINNIIQNFQIDSCVYKFFKWKSSSRSCGKMEFIKDNKDFTMVFGMRRTQQHCLN